MFVWHATTLLISVDLSSSFEIPKKLLREGTKEMLELHPLGTELGSELIVSPMP